MIAWRNLKVLYIKAKDRIVLLEAENKRLKERIKELEEKDRGKDRKIEAMAYQLEQINAKVFGKKPIAHSVLCVREKKPRDADSYRRPLPQSTTDIKRHPVHECASCHGPLSNKNISVFFEEDIPLPIQKIVIRHEVEVGYCAPCKRQSSGCIIPSKKVILGDNVKKYVCVLSIANRLSHNPIKEHLLAVFDMPVSLGEIGNILREEAIELRPEYERLKTSVVRQEATHYDETSWKVAKEEHGAYAWVATGTENNDTVFMCGRSRGKGNVEEIGIAPVGITDDYGVYKNPFPEHQLCWAHPQRKLRDLAETKEFDAEKRVQCVNIYHRFSSLYRTIEKKLQSPWSPYMKNKLQTVFDELSESHSLDPTPLSKIKESLRKNKDKYFTFFKHPGIPIDNNKAERALRHLVIKRKISFGSKTQRGAETTSVLASVILSLKWNNPGNWFERYLELKG